LRSWTSGATRRRKNQKIDFFKLRSRWLTGDRLQLYLDYIVTELVLEEGETTDSLVYIGECSFRVYVFQACLIMNFSLCKFNGLIEVFRAICTVGIFSSRLRIKGINRGKPAI
jgi:hypothetical protein